MPVARFSAAVFLAICAFGQPKLPAGEPYVYKHAAERELKLYVQSPSGTGAARPAIVFFHGGGWTGGAPSQFNELGKHLTNRGMVVIQVEYRLLERGTTDPPVVCIQDAKSSMRWVRAHARQFGIDPNRIASGGGSAGGHLAAFVGMMDGIDDPADDQKVSPGSNAMVLFNPVFDNGPDGWGHARVGDRYREFSPFHNIRRGMPPAIVLAGSQDKLLPVSTVTAFCQQAKSVGTMCETRVYEGQPHGFFNYKPDNRFYTETLQAADEFLTRIGWLPASNVQASISRAIVSR